MMPFNLLVLACVTYVAFLFLVAFVVERRAAAGAARWLRSPLVYTLSLSIYCTAWTFYGAVGYAARSGLEFLTIYLGPTLVFIGWYAQGQLSIVQITGAIKTLAAGADLSSFLYDPVSLLIIAFTLVSFFIWGRGTFCGWLCPFGALQEFVAMAVVDHSRHPARIDRKRQLALGRQAVTQAGLEVVNARLSKRSLIDRGTRSLAIGVKRCVDGRVETPPFASHEFRNSRHRKSQLSCCGSSRGGVGGQVKSRVYSQLRPHPPWLKLLQATPL